MNKFEKISFAEFIKHFDPIDWTQEEIKEIYENIKLPCRSTSGSAGYDFFSPVKIGIGAGASIIVPTGIRCFLDEDKVLQVYPRSGLGFKFHMGLANTVGIIDSDYVNSDNEGHIMIKIVNNGNKILEIERNKAFAQGIVTQYFTVENDNETEKQMRNGGFGSTNV